MQVQFTGRGIFLEELDLWMDGGPAGSTAWISHGHADHGRTSATTVFATPATAAILEARGLVGTERLRPVEYGASWEWAGARLTAYPASHILGAASLLIEWQGERLLYTGDIKWRQPMLGVRTEIPACDRLIIESTFGLPVFHFLDQAVARARIQKFARESLELGVTPVFVGYSLGRGQEIVHALCEAGIETSGHGAIAKLMPVYEKYGYDFPGWEPYGAKVFSGKAVVIPPSFRNSIESSGKNLRFAYVSGWAAFDSARARAKVEELIPYSDHGDFQELLAMVEASGAREVDVVHGYTEAFCRILARRGLTARAPAAASGREDEEDIEG